MVLKNQKWDKLMGILYENPGEEYTIRQISNKTKIPSSSVQRYLDNLKVKGYVTENNKLIINPYIKFHKSFFLIDKLYTSGLLEYLEKELVPSVVILYGGVRKGEYDKNSDIDLYVETTKKKKLSFLKYERKLGHNVHVIVNEDISKLNKHLLNNVVNGIKLMGFFTIK